jgi:nucleoside-diphosphate-sugar epimerase
VGKRNQVESHWNQFGQIKKISIVNIKNAQIRDHKLKNPIIFHLAGYGQPAKFMTDPSALVYLNTEMIFDLMSLEPQSISYVSTTEIYSGQTISCDEKTSTIIKPEHPRAPYVFSKLLGESILRNSTCQTGVFRVALATPPMFYGDDTRVLADLVRTAARGNDVFLKGGHSSLRSYQYGPLCIAKLLYTMTQTKESFTVNLSGGEEITLETLGRKIASIFEVNYIDAPNVLEIGAPDVVRIDSSKIETFWKKQFKREKVDDLLRIYSSNLTG